MRRRNPVEVFFDFLLDDVMNWPGEAQIIIFAFTLALIIKFFEWVF